MCSCAAPIRCGKIGWLPQARIFVIGADYTGFKRKRADRHVGWDLLVEPSPVRKKLGFALSGWIENHANAGRPVVSKRIVQESAVHLLLLEPKSRLNGQMPAKVPRVLNKT